MALRYGKHDKRCAYSYINSDAIFHVEGCECRLGDSALTRNGIEYYPMDPRPEEVLIDDVAHALSRICRFGGHVNCEWYSVAEHSILVSEMCDPKDALEGLLHDAAEAYVGDMVSPLKRSMKEFSAVERLNHRAISTALGIRYDMPYSVEEADLRMLLTEAGRFMPNTQGFPTFAAPYSDSEIVFKNMRPDIARDAFLRRYWELVK